jgi:lipoyl(octanoyl) transferase
VNETLSVVSLGPTPDREGLALQAAAVLARAAGRAPDRLLYPDHPPVLTVGRSPSAGSVIASPEALRQAGIEVFEVARGGDVTWHGPGQLVGYLICDLDRRGRDLHRFLRDIEQGLIDALAGWGIEAGREAGRTGVWSNGEKIASIGIAVRRWVSYHGFALNVAPDLRFFDLIHPCGLRGIQMTSVAKRLGDRAPSMAEARAVVASQMAKALGFTGLVREDAAALRRSLMDEPGMTPGTHAA